MYIFVSKWAREEELDESISMSLMAMIYFIFLAVNSLTYFGMTTLQTFSAIVFRIGSIFEMDEYDFSKRQTEVKPEEVCVKFEKADISWGYKVKTENAEDKAKKQNKYEGPKIEKVDQPMIAGVNLDMRTGDFLTIIGTVGCGKSTMLMSVM